MSFAYIQMHFRLDFFMEALKMNPNQIAPAPFGAVYLDSYCLQYRPLSSTGSILSNTDLSDLSTVGTCDIFVYQMRHRVM